eukprot:CAMPEP_0184377536 /NCGR_PEP_ID=MMETSP0007-20130409/2340_1 /TAXON_ID=97485 /ORGANISM="Prymnesium parvum, Strain Texoma1" /LENGTH=115 /DNA_ID=CAMNT_0026721463 /DNA_START=137 /DNA_END=480 /DNA_ORIENTATION=+
MTQELQHTQQCHLSLFHMSITLSDDFTQVICPAMICTNTRREHAPAVGAALLPLDEFCTLRKTPMAREPKAMLTWKTNLEPRIGWAPETVGEIERRTWSTSSCGSWRREGEGRGG